MPTRPRASCSSGEADLIALARELLYNPNWPMDAAQKLGVDPRFALVPPASAYWLEKRARQVKDDGAEHLSGNAEGLTPAGYVIPCNKDIPSVTATPLWQYAATDLAALIQAGEVSATEAVRASVERMHAVNPALNAVVTDLSEAALDRAKALDAAKGPKGALHGVPITIKINIDQAGEASSNGVVAFKDLVAPGDAPLVKNLLDAGAVVIGRTNVPEFSRRCDTDNPLFGRTWNPWGRHVSPGGSSGGAGAAVAAGIGALGHGNDIGGSLRFPAAGNGVVTVKPGVGRVAVYNPSQTAERGILAQQMSAQGLLARSARDLHLAMPAMIAPDPRDPFHVPLPWRGPALAGPMKVGFSLEAPDLPLHPEVEKALRAARDALVDAGYVVEEVTPPSLREIAFEGRQALMTESYHLMAEDIAKYGSPAIVGVFEQNYRRTPTRRDQAQCWSCSPAAPSMRGNGRC